MRFAGVVVYDGHIEASTMIDSRKLQVPEKSHRHSVSSGR